MAVFLILLLEFVLVTNSQIFQTRDYFGTRPVLEQYHRGGIVGLGSNRLEYRNVLGKVNFRIKIQKKVLCNAPFAP